LSIINSIVFGIRALPEAKIGLVNRMAKREKDSCRLYALAFDYLDLLFCQPVKLVEPLPPALLFLNLHALYSTNHIQ